MWQAKPYNHTFKPMTSRSSSWNRTTTESMQQRGPSKPSKTTSSPGSAPQIKISHPNCGTNSSSKHKTPSTCCAPHALILPSLRMKFWKVPTTSTGIHGHHRDAEPYSTNQQQPEHHGALEERTHGTSAQPCITIVATNFMFLKLDPIPSQHQLNSSPLTVTFPPNHHSKLLHAPPQSYSSNSANNVTHKIPPNSPATNVLSKSSMKFINSTPSNLRGWIPKPCHLRGWNPPCPVTLPHHASSAAHLVSTTI